MTQEIVRALVNGVWVTEVASQGGGGGGISEITSDDHTVTVTNPSGPTVDLSASGGSQTVEFVHVPIAFDTPNLVVQQFPITDVDTDTQVVTIAGLHASKFPVGRWAGIFGSSEADSTYTVDDVAEVGGSTEVTLLSALSGTFDAASLLNVGTAGVTVPLADGDKARQRVAVSVTTSFDGSSPKLWSWIGASTAGNVGWLNDFDLDTSDTPVSDSPGWFFTSELQSPADTFVYPTEGGGDLVFFVGGSSYEDPVMSQGEGELIIEVVRAET